MALPEEEVLGQSSSATWLDLMGSSNWEGLLEPLNSDLRRLILRCGDFCQVTYDTFINDKLSPYCGASRFAKTDLLQKTAFPGGSDRYDVVGYLYATARVSVPEAFLLKSLSRERWDRESNWIGYVAVTNEEASREMGRREIYVAWRGTIRDYEWVDVLGAKLDSAKFLLRPHPVDSLPLSTGIEPPTAVGNEVVEDDGETNSFRKTLTKMATNFCPCLSLANNNDHEESNHKEPKVMQGWLTVYSSDDPKSAFTKLSARAQLTSKLKTLIHKYKDEDLSITFCGHSLGATLSVVSAFDVAENITKDIPISAFVFGCPKVGNEAFKDRFDSYPNLKVLHIRNTIDLIPHYPSGLMGYVNLGSELEIDTRKSHYLNDSKNPSDWHNLQAILHVVNGWQGMKKEFELKIERSIALVNKSCGFLKEENLVPVSWWIEKNKGMVLNEKGDWVLAGPEENPVPEFD